MEQFLTPGASRVFELAAQIARAANVAEISPEHLLWALILDESRAAEILQAHSLSHARLLELLGTAPELPEDRPEAASLPDAGELLQSILIEARQHAASLGRGVEVGTEHLLVGLAKTPSAVQQLLSDHGLDAQRADERSADQGGHSTEPIAAGIELSLAPPAGDDTNLYRILDAAANRCREGLRVLEDYARFNADDRHLTTLLKQWRHRLAGALAFLDGRGLIASRDTRQDVGTTIHTRREATRGTLLDVVKASCKRVQEAARTLEEYGKIVSAEFAQTLGELRYSSYTLEKALLTTIESRSRLPEGTLYVLVTQALCPNGAGPVIRAALAGGAGVIQVREKTLPDRELVDWGHRVREWTAAAGALFIMNDRPDLAVLADADGVHVGQEELSVRDARRIVGPHKLVGVSTHTIEQARAAVLDGADYIGVGPVFPSSTKNFSAFAGLDFARQVAEEITLPAFAIGGIDTGNVMQVVATGIRRVAVSGAICGAADPRGAAEELRSRLAAGAQTIG